MAKVLIVEDNLNVRSIRCETAVLEPRRLLPFDSNNRVAFRQLQIDTGGHTGVAGLLVVNVSTGRKFDIGGNPEGFAGLDFFLVSDQGDVDSYRQSRSLVTSHDWDRWNNLLCGAYAGAQKQKDTSER